MNAFKLIELLDKNSGEGNTPIRQAIELLRQQSDRIVELEKVVSFCEDRMFKLEYKNTHPVKQLSDEQISEFLYAYCLDMGDVYEATEEKLIECVRAIIKEITE